MKKIIQCLGCLGLAACCAGGAQAAGNDPLKAAGQKMESALTPNDPAPGPSVRAVNFKISFRIKAENLESSGNFVVQDGTQGNYMLGGDTPVSVTDNSGGKGAELKKYGTIVNCLPAADPRKSKMVNLQCQFELSGPRPPAAGTLLGFVTFQLQTQVLAEKGVTLLLVDEPARRVEIKVEEFK